MGQNFSLYCGYRIRGVPMPLITWSYDNGLPIEPMLVGPDTSGAYYRYIPEMKEGNKTLKMVSTQMRKKQTEEISSREFELAKSFAGKYIKNKVFDKIRMAQFEMPSEKKVVLEGFLEENFDYQSSNSIKYSSMQEIRHLLSKEIKAVRKLSPLYQ